MGGATANAPSNTQLNFNMMYPGVYSQDNSKEIASSITISDLICWWLSRKPEHAAGNP